MTKVAAAVIAIVAVLDKPLSLKTKPAKKERKMTTYAPPQFNQASGNSPIPAAITQVPNRLKLDIVSSRLERQRAIETFDILEIMEGTGTTINLSKPFL